MNEDGVRAVEALRKIVFEGRLSSRVRVMEKVVDMSILSTGEMRQVALHPRLKDFSDAQLKDPVTVGSFERMKLIVSFAVKTIDGTPIHQAEMLAALDDLSETQVMRFITEYVNLVRLETEANQAETLKNSLTTPTQGSGGQ